jgi:vacuolar-type H+-ATPase subunit H
LFLCLQIFMDTELEGTLSRLAKAERDGEAGCERAQAEGRIKVEDARRRAIAILDEARAEAELALTRALADAAMATQAQENSIAAKARTKAAEYSRFKPPKGLIDELVTEVGRLHV